MHFAIDAASVTALSSLLLQTAFVSYYILCTNNNMFNIGGGSDDNDHRLNNFVALQTVEWSALDTHDKLLVEFQRCSSNDFSSDFTVPGQSEK